MALRAVLAPVSVLRFRCDVRQALLILLLQRGHHLPRVQRLRHADQRLEERLYSTLRLLQPASHA